MQISSKTKSDIAVINKIEQINSWTVVPNPATNEISLGGIEGVIENIQIIDMTGKTLMELTELTIIDLSAMNSGAYIVRVVVDGKVQQMKFIKD